MVKQGTTLFVLLIPRNWIKKHNKTRRTMVATFCCLNWKKKLRCHIHLILANRHNCEERSHPMLFGSSTDIWSKYNSTNGLRNPDCRSVNNSHRQFDPLYVVRWHLLATSKEEIAKLMIVNDWDGQWFYANYWVNSGLHCSCLKSHVKFHGFLRFGTCTTNFYSCTSSFSLNYVFHSFSLIALLSSNPNGFGLWNVCF